MTSAGDVASADAGGTMSPIAVNQALAHLLQVQGGLIDAYLSQNLGKRYAFALVVLEQDAPRHVAGVTNLHATDLVRAQMFDMEQEAGNLVAPLGLRSTPCVLDAGD